jgi:hypothetical protein
MLIAKINPEYAQAQWVYSRTRTAIAERGRVCQLGVDANRSPSTIIRLANV